MRTKFWPLAWLLIISALMLSCTAVPATTAPTSPPPSTSLPPTAILPQSSATPLPLPTAAVADDWARIQAEGKLVVGTAADYPPFSYFNELGQLDGFDVALIRDLGRRLGVAVEINDFAFDGLLGAVYVNQIDASIAAMSITPERLALIDFTNLYYLGTDGLLARSNSGITSIGSPDHMAGYRVAVQRNSVYQDWVQKNLVDVGRIRGDQIYVYDKPENAVRDMRENRVDLVMMDLTPAQTWASGDVALVGQGLATQQFAIGVHKDSTLLAQLNRVLSEARSDGTLDRLAEQYLRVEVPPTQVAPQPTPTPPLPPTPQPTAAPVPTSAPPPCVYSMGFVRDNSYDDANMTNPPRLVAGQAFQKGWRIKNTGTCDWNANFYLVYVRGNVPAAQMNGQPVAMPRIVPVGNEVDINVNLIAPSYPGTYQGFWQMVAPSGERFGQTIWVGIMVPGADPTPLPNEPVIESLAASPGNILVGNCTSLSWRVSGAISEIEIKRGNDTLWRNAPYSGTYEDCLNGAGTYTYRLTANGPGGSTARTATVVVSNPPPPANPIIYAFGIRPREIGFGSCATITWKTGNADTVELYRGTTLINRLGAEGTFQDCPDTAGNLTYRLVAKGRNINTESTYNLLVMSGRPPR